MRSADKERERVTIHILVQWAWNSDCGRMEAEANRFASMLLGSILRFTRPSLRDVLSLFYAPETANVQPGVEGFDVRAPSSAATDRLNA